MDRTATRQTMVISDKYGPQLEVSDPSDLHPAKFSQHYCPKFDAKMPDLIDQCKQLKRWEGKISCNFRTHLLWSFVKMQKSRPCKK